MTTPTARLAAVRSSTAALIRGLRDEQWSDADVQRPSLLPGWSRGHVLAHIARNADGIARTLSGALRGALVARYPDGPAGRDADIAAGAGRPVNEALQDVEQSADRLDRVCGAVADAGAWELPTDQERPAARWLPARWREVEIHRVDLDGSYTADKWPAEFVTYLLPRLAERLAGRTSESLRVEVQADESISADLPGAVWTSGTRADRVTGPDWALLAWLLGRPNVAAGALNRTPPLSPWA
jgi:maleylpyruvate isomerase